MDQDQLRKHLKDKLRKAFRKKFKQMEGYIDEMIDTADGRSPAECGLDPEFNIDEFIKDLEDLI